MVARIVSIVEDDIEMGIKIHQLYNESSTDNTIGQVKGNLVHTN